MPYRRTDQELGRLRQRRADILTAAMATVQSTGFGGAQARVIAAVAGVSVGSLYSNFDGIDGLHAEVFRTLAERELRRVAEEIDAADGPAEAIGAIVRGFGARSLQAPVQAWALLLEPVSPAIELLRLHYRGDYAELAAGVIHEGMLNGDLPQQAVEVSAPALIGAISESLVRPLNPTAAEGRPAADADLIEEIVALCLRAVGAVA